VLMITEGTYPYAVGGVSSWCEVLIGALTDIDWRILPIVAGGRRLQPHFALPPGARLLRPIDLWSEGAPPPRALPRRRRAGPMIVRGLVRGLLPWRGNPAELTDALVLCRAHRREIRREFRSRQVWDEYLRTLADVLREGHEETAPTPEYDALEAARLYQTLYWIARTAAVPTPPCDLVHVTAAGWSAIPALVHKSLFGTPMLLTEHGVFVRETYLTSIRERAAPARQHMNTRVALGLTSAAYAVADMIAPVTESNADWERRLGVEPRRIRVIPNGIPSASEPTPLPATNRVVTVGRIDPLKDVQTMLLVAAEVTARVSQARFEYWGPPTAGQDVYARACETMRDQLRLGDRFRFMGSTADPHRVLRSGDVVLMTSISEGMPMALLEAMAQGRPAVATSVGGVPGVLRGCGIVARPGDVHGLAAAVVTLLRTPELAATLGRRGYERLRRRYTLERCIANYRDLIGDLIVERV
jgi:glycosyltransferase involved in cell wall biosynthesis